MNLRYLCVNHRQQLLADPSRAEGHWQQWMKTGSRLYEEGRYREAITFLGCAYELADHFLDASLPSNEVAFSRFTYSSICLARAYEQIGEVETRHYLVSVADSRLAEAMLDIRHYDHVARCKQSLRSRSDSCYWVNSRLLPGSISESAMRVH